MIKAARKHAVLAACTFIGVYHQYFCHRLYRSNRDARTFAQQIDGLPLGN